LSAKCSQRFHLGKGKGGAKSGLIKGGRSEIKEGGGLLNKRKVGLLTRRAVVSGRPDMKNKGENKKRGKGGAS